MKQAPDSSFASVDLLHWPLGLAIRCIPTSLVLMQSLTAQFLFLGPYTNDVPRTSSFLDAVSSMLGHGLPSLFVFAGLQDLLMPL